MIDSEKVSRMERRVLNVYNYCDPKEIKPAGWLLKQLQIQAQGLAGNLDKVWPDVRESAWIGGDKEGWERVPYWLDGFIPLAYLLENEDMKQRAERYISAILEHQQEDGWICPCTLEERPSYDIWSWFLIGKVLALYCEYTDSEKAESALYRSMKCMYSLIKHGQITLFDWGKFRWFECMIPLYYLYEKYPEAWILELAEALKNQGTDYEELCSLWERPLNAWKLETHIVNLAMMLKSHAVYNKLLGKEDIDRAEYFWQHLDKYNGTAAATFTGDECLSGIGNNHGTELCSVVELMYSCELLYAITEAPIWMERLEKIAFNALPAAISDDMWTHQYDQQVNQIACVRFPGKSLFRTNNSEAHLFGLEPHFGCCTANMGQGWPKLAMSIFRKNSRGFQTAMMLPAALHTTWQGANVTISLETEYPFRHSGKYNITTDKPVEFELKIRIPQWVQRVRINGSYIEHSGYYAINQCWNGMETIQIDFETEPHFSVRPYNLHTVEYGPLVFSLPLATEYKKYEYEKNGVERKYPYCDYELTSQSEWRYGFADHSLTVYEQKGNEIPFSSLEPRVSIKAKFSRIDWDFADGYNTVAEKTPNSAAALSEPREMLLIPYGCAKLRMTEMPFCE